MKNKLILITIILTLMFSSAIVFANSDFFAYTGTDSYTGLYNNIKFTDIANHPAKASIYKLASFSIIREMGNNKYNPNNNITREQAISTIIRFIGLEEEAQQQAEKVNPLDTGQYSILTTEDYLAKAHIDIAIRNNILNQNDIKTQLKNNENNIKEELDKFLAKYDTEEINLTQQQRRNIEKELKQKIEDRYYIKKSATKEEILVWIGKSLKLEPIYGPAQQKIYNLKDWRSIKLENLPIIEAIMNIKGMEKYIGSSLNPSRPYTKAQFAAIIDTILNNSPEVQGITIGEGRVRRITDLITTEEDWQENSIIFIEKRTIELLYNNTKASLIFEQSDYANYNKGFIVYKNGAITNHKSIHEGDYVKYYIDKNGKAIFVEVLEQ